MSRYLLALALLLVALHPLLALGVLAAELAVLAVIATGIARSAGFTFRIPIPWRS